MENLDKIYYINLDKRIDRKQLFEKEIEKYELPRNKIERFPAIFNKIGMIGCNESHLAILKLALKNKYENILVFEDDFEFLVSKDKFYELLNDFFLKYQYDYDVCFLQYSLVEIEDKDDLIGKVKKSHGAGGYLINKKIIPEYINILETATKNLIETHEHWKYQNDVCWHELQKKRNFYYFKERIGKQRGSYSDLSDQYVDRNF